MAQKPQESLESFRRAAYERAMPSPHEDSPAQTPPGARSGRRPYLLASLAPLVVVVVGYFLMPAFAGDEARIQALRRGVAIGGLTGWVLALGVGLWTHRAVGKGGAAFLAPMAGGFLAKLFVLGIGTLLLAGPLSRSGDPISFALCFVATVFGFQLLFFRCLRFGAPGGEIVRAGAVPGDSRMSRRPVPSSNSRPRS